MENFEQQLLSKLGEKLGKTPAVKVAPVEPKPVNNTQRHDSEVREFYENIYKPDIETLGARDAYLLNRIDELQAMFLKYISEPEKLLEELKAKAKEDERIINEVNNPKPKPNEENTEDGATFIMGRHARGEGMKEDDVFGGH